jgi:hypothetical protein
MLHLVVLSHQPESCPSHPHIREPFVECFTKLTGLLSQPEAKVLGNWIDPPAHQNFVLVEAPNAHAVLNALAESGITRYTSSVIHPVLDLLATGP